MPMTPIPQDQQQVHTISSGASTPSDHPDVKTEPDTTPEAASEEQPSTPSEKPQVLTSLRPGHVLTDRQRRINELRLKFCVRDEFPITQKMIHPDGTLNQEAEVARKWTDKERDLLIKGIEKHGIGHFREISEEFLSAWSGNDLRVKTMRLVGRQNLQLYKDWKGGEAEMARELELNKAIGLKYGAWKAGTLVADDEGMVIKAIAEQWPDQAAKMAGGAGIASSAISADVDTPRSGPDDEDVDMEEDEPLTRNRSSS
ncbi:hypothetical protein DFQ27_006490 [Actinomortierella ambigua]|uniref:Myb-like domain-containing protein n=1 Tax=Actinomortierella ambigua TaxID=1343610 RepID=A0A9P6U115_9FUNG|nr:hypothetical protein DFQ27_006490 [Actinomortierella ambigua]